MIQGTSDLTSSLVPKLEQHLRYGQGVIVHWNRFTHENVVSLHGGKLKNLPVIRSMNSRLDFEQGDSVALIGWNVEGKKGVGIWFILGKFSVPSITEEALVAGPEDTTTIESRIETLEAGQDSLEAGQDSLDSSQAAQDTLISDLQGQNAVPSGIITMWSGAIVDVPSGWLLCDGTSGTPDLRDRFIVGAGSAHFPNDIGGSDSVTLTESELPAHGHNAGTLSADSAGDHNHGAGSLDTNSTGSHTHNIPVRPYDISGGNPVDDAMRGTTAGSAEFGNNTDSDGGHSHNVSGSTANAGSHGHTISGATADTGGGAAHENRPAFYALAYIMKA